MTDGELMAFARAVRATQTGLRILVPGPTRTKRTALVECDRRAAFLPALVVALASAVSPERAAEALAVAAARANG